MQTDRTRHAGGDAADRNEYMRTMLKDLEELAASEGHETLAQLLQRAGAEVCAPVRATDRIAQIPDMIAQLKRIAVANGAAGLADHLNHALDEARRVTSQRPQDVSRTP